MGENISLIGVIIAMFSACWFGGTIVYIAKFYRKYEMGFQTSWQYIKYAFSGDIFTFYKNYYKKRKELGFNRMITMFLILSHPISFFTFYLGPILTSY